MIKVYVIIVDRGNRQSVDSVHRFRSSANNRKFELLNEGDSILSANIIEKELEWN